jgi:hypothetical protein
MDISKKNVREYRKGNEKLSPKRNWQHRVHKTKTNKHTTQRNWQHRVHKTKTNKTHNTIGIGHQYLGKKATNNVNKT